MTRILIFLLVCLPLVSSCSSSGVMPGEFGIDHFGGGGVGPGNWSYPPGCSPPAHVKPMGLITCDDFYSGVRGELWTTNTVPEFHVLLEEGDGYIPADIDFAAYVDEVQVKVKLNSYEEVSFQPINPLKPGIHNIAITFWPPESYPQARALTFDVCTEPAKITSCLGNEEEGYYLMFFDKPLNKGISESKLNWSITDFNDVFSNIELINGGLTAVVSVNNDMLPDMKSAPSIEFRFNGSRGLSIYTQKNLPDRSGERYGQAPPPDCSCEIVVHSNEGNHPYDQTEENAYCYQIEAAGSPPCDVAITWKMQFAQPVDNADPWGDGMAFVMTDPEYFGPETWDFGGFSPLSIGYHTKKFNRNSNHSYLALVYANCLEEEPEGYETYKGMLYCEFFGADIEPPEFKKDTPLLLTGPEAADKIISILDKYDKPGIDDAHYICGTRLNFEQQYVDTLRNDPCKLVLLVFAKDNKNLKGNYSPYALEYKENEEIGMGTMGIAYMARFDEYPIATDEYVSWNDPAYNKEYDNDGCAFNEYELNYWVLNEHFGADLSGLADADFLRVRVEDHAVDDSGHGNWRRSEDFLPEALAPHIYGIKAYQQFTDHYVEADYDDGPTFARNSGGLSIIDFAVAVGWSLYPPEFIEVAAMNSPINEPHLPVGCARTCNFNTYRLEDRQSDEYAKLRDLFFGDGATESTTYCVDFYMRGSGLTYQGQPHYAPKLTVSDDVLTLEGYSPILYMSHSDHRLPEEYRDDYSTALACGVDKYSSSYFRNGDLRGEYVPAGRMINVQKDLKLGGTGKLILFLYGGNETEISVQSGADLFVSASHGGVSRVGCPDGALTPHIGYYRARDSYGKPSGCTPLTNNPCDVSNFWTVRFKPTEFDNFSATKWWVNIACWQLNDSVGWHNYWDALIATNKLQCIGGYGYINDPKEQEVVGSGNLSVAEKAAPYFNDILAGIMNPDDDLWGVPRSGDIFIWAWMESHCLVIRENDTLRNWTRSARAIDGGYLFYIEEITGRSLLGLFYSEFLINKREIVP